MPTPGGVMVLRSVCALGVVLGVVAHGVKVARLVGDGVAVIVRPDAVRGVVAHGREAAQIGARVCPSPPGLKWSARVCLCMSFAPYIYIIGKNKLF